tara:strand:+ start:298 stop:489 length:192 start_codon:yes stop_codon:yes gene_type:complete
MISKRYQEALDEFYDISDEEGVDIIVISMELFNKLTNGKVHPFIDRVHHDSASIKRSEREVHS